MSDDDLRRAAIKAALDPFFAAGDDTPAAAIIDAQRRERIATERAERAEANEARADAVVETYRIGLQKIADERDEWQERIKALESALSERSEAAYSLEIRAARLAKRARKWKRKAKEWERDREHWYGQGYFDGANEPADFNPAEAFLHTAPLPVTDAMVEAAMSAVTTRDGKPSLVAGTRSGILAALEAAERTRIAEMPASAPETPAQPQFEPAGHPEPSRPEMAAYGQSEAREPTTETARKVSRDKNGTLAAAVRLVLEPIDYDAVEARTYPPRPLPPGAWDEPTSLDGGLDSMGDRV